LLRKVFRRCKEFVNADFKEALAMEINAIQVPSDMNVPDVTERTREITEQERIRQLELEQQAQVEMRARSPEQSAGRFVDQVV